MQKYINSRTIDGNPFDVRVHMMKDKNDEWEFASIYLRIGVDFATISSTLSGGYVGNITGLLKRNFPNDRADILEGKIKKISMDIAGIFSGFYNVRFNEITLDIALNERAQLYLIEININKSGIMNEFEIAKLAIPNAIYLAEKKTK